MEHYNHTMKMWSTQLYQLLMNIHKNSFENVHFFAVFQKLHHNFEQKIKYFKDYGRDIRSQNLKHTFS